VDPTLASLASALAAALAPFTPYLVKGGEAFAKRAGDAAWTHAQRVWQSIRSRFGDDARIEGSARMLSADPEDRETLAIFAKAIAAQLLKHPDSVPHFISLLGGAEASQTIASRHRSLVEDVTQHLGGGGTQRVVADHGSVIRRVRQDQD
jgi:hypothetical protein